MIKTRNSVGFDEIRNVLKYHREVAKKVPTFYRVDDSGVYQYFLCCKNYREQIFNYFDKLRADKVPIIHLDICGIAAIQSFGGHKSYCFSLKDKTEIDWRGNQIVQGDLFNGGDFIKFLSKVRSDSEKPALITFRPIVGLQDNCPSGNEKYPRFRDITERILEKRFGQCVSVLRRGGFMYIERPFQLEPTEFADFFNRIPQEEWELSVKMKNLAKKYHCNIKIESSIHGPKFLIRKRRN